MTQLAAVSNGQLSDASQLNQYRNLYRGNYVFDPVNGYGADPTAVADSTTALTNCINDANALNPQADGQGGIIVCPQGEFKLTAALPTIKVPFIGSGIRRTMFKQVTNLGTSGGLGGGTGIPTMVFDSNTDAVTKTAYGAHFSLLGPAGVGAMGAHLAAGAGIQLNTSLFLDNVEVRGFDVGGVTLNSPYGHITFFNCVLLNNYYNVWAFIDHGNLAFHDCDLTGPAKASIGMPGGTSLDFAYLCNTHMGFGPYGIYQDSQTAIGQNPSTNGNFLTGCKFANAYFEGIGNAAMKSEQYATAGVISGSQFENPGHLFNAGFTQVAESTDYAIWCGNLGGVRFVGGEYQFANGQIAAIICNPSGYIEWDAGPTTLVNVGSADNPWFKMKMSPGYLRPEGSASIPSASSSTVISIPFAGLISQVQDVSLIPTGVGAQTAGFALYVTNIQSSAPLNPKLPTLAQVATGTGNLSNGTYTYGLTYVNANGESLFTNYGSLPQVVVDASHKQVTVNLPTFPQLGGYSPITSRKIYRGTVGVSTPTSLKLLATIADGYTTTSYTDNIADGSLGATYPNADSSGATKFTVNCIPANPSGSALPFNWRIPT